jgi:PAS domain S-box-containing protein
MLPEIAVIVTDRDRHIQWVNEEFTSITGYSLDEVVGKKPNLLQGAETEQDAIRRIRHGLESHIPFKDQITNYRKNGEKYLCKLVIHPIYNKQQRLTNFIAFEIDGDKTDDSTIPLMNLRNKYSTSSLKGPEGAMLFNQLKNLLLENRLYLNPKLSLKELADQLHTNTKYLSQVVNMHSGMNLQVFLNKFRIEEAKRKLLDSEFENLTLYGIAMQCGFKNKSTFYKVFKQQTGLTPLQFIKQELV